MRPSPASRRPMSMLRAMWKMLNITGQAQPVARIMTGLPGAGYTVAPTVTVVPGPGGCTTLPAATAGINPIGAVSLLTAGTGYTSAPTVTLGPPLAGGAYRLRQRQQ